MPEHVRIVARARLAALRGARALHPPRCARPLQGQKQIWFLLQLVGRDSDMNLRATTTPSSTPGAGTTTGCRWSGDRVQARRLRDGADRAARFLPRAPPPQPLPARACDRSTARKSRIPTSPGGGEPPPDDTPRGPLASPPQARTRVVAVDHLRLGAVAEQALELAGRFARDQARLGAAVVRQARAISMPEGPRTAITSPRWNSPCTSTTPIGSRLLPSSRSFFTAPASTTTAPRNCR